MDNTVIADIKILPLRTGKAGVSQIIAECVSLLDKAPGIKYRVTPSMVGINIGIAAPMSFFPFGGAGNSMFGDTKGHGQEIFNFFTDTKVVIERWL